MEWKITKKKNDLGNMLWCKKTIVGIPVQPKKSKSPKDRVVPLPNGLTNGF